MAYPPPTEKQARILWASVTALAIGVLIGLTGVLVLGMAKLASMISSVLLPLAIAGVIAYLLDPVVDWFQKKRGFKRQNSIILVFIIALLLVGGLVASVVPPLIEQTTKLTSELPKIVKTFQTRVGSGPASNEPGDSQTTSTNAPAKPDWFEAMRERVKKIGFVNEELIEKASKFAVNTVSAGFHLAAGAVEENYVALWLPRRLGAGAGVCVLFSTREAGYQPELDGLSPGARLVGQGGDRVRAALDQRLPGRLFPEPSAGGHVRGRAAHGRFFAIGLKYAILLGVIAGLLSIIPYLGVALSIIPVFVLAMIQFVPEDGWLKPVLILVWFAAVQAMEGLFISPKIIGDRVGLHPLTIIVAVMVGTTLLGGVIGGVLAIPLTAALRTLMFRYVWKDRVHAGDAPAAT